MAAGNVHPKELTLVLPRGINVSIEFIDPPSNDPAGPIVDPNVRQAVTPDGMNAKWNGCGCGGGNCIC